MARQLTLLEWAYFSVIPNHEFFNKAWSSSDGQRAPSIRSYIDRFNQVRRSVGVAIAARVCAN
jgi:hypothetical protein